MKKIALVVILIGLIVLFYVKSKPWTLSLYRDGITILRIDYKSKDECLFSGMTYVKENTTDRFDCGYKCSFVDRSNLSSSPICKQVCDKEGCR